MAAMTKKERVLATFRGEPTDRVPLYDLMLNDDCIEYFTGTYPPYGEEGARLQAQAVDLMLDMARGVGRGPTRPPGDFTTDPVLLEYARYANLTYKLNTLTSYDSAVEWLKQEILRLRNWRETTDLDAETEIARLGFAKLDTWLSDDHVVCCLRQSGTGQDHVRGMMGIESFAYVCADEPGLVSEYLELATEREVAIIHEIADPSLSRWALTYGDIGAKAKLLHSPDWLRAEFFPRLKRINDAYHEHDIFCLFHSDGYIMEVMPDLIDAGIDGLNPIETVAGMDVGEVYQAYGHRIFLAGGIDMSQLLSHGTPEQVRDVWPGRYQGGPDPLFHGIYY